MKNGIMPVTLAIITGLLFSIAVNSAAAQNFYGGISAGSTEFDDSIFSDRNVAWAVQLGWDINRYLGLELSYTDHQEFDPRVSDVLSTRPKTISLSGLVKLPLSEWIEGYGKIGWTRLDVDIANSSINYRDSINENEVLYGIGVDFRIIDDWKLRIAYDRTKLKLGNIPLGFGGPRILFAQSEGHLDLVSIGLVWKF